MGKNRYEASFELKEIGADGRFKGYASVYGNVDYGGDKIEQFASKASLKVSGGKMPILRNHSATIEDIVGENISATEDDKGLSVEGCFNLNTESGRDTYEKVKFAKEHGRKMGLSIGYIPDRKSIDYVDGVRVLKKIDVLEYSVVVFPMNPKAKIQSIKSFCESADEQEISHKKRELEATLRDVGCSQKEQKVAISAIFALRDVDEKKKQEELEAEQQTKTHEALEGFLAKIKK